MGGVMLTLRMLIFALVFALAGFCSTSAFAAMGGASSHGGGGGASSIGATTAAAHAGNAAASSALANTISSGTCKTNCLSKGRSDCQSHCRPGICYLQGSPFCIK